MKKVSSKVKLELAQYRELASFSQFGSDIDKDTKDRLDHGRILMEILKQSQYSPIDVVDQIIIIYAASHHWLMDIEVERIKEFEKELYSFIDTHYAQIKKAIRESGEISADTEALLKEAIAKFKTTSEVKDMLVDGVVCIPV